jgi:hypothetical protein
VSFTVSNPKILRKGTLVGTVDLAMPSGLVVRGLMLFEKNDKRWCSFPSKEWTGQDGKKNYSPLLEFASREIGDRFQEQVRPLVEEAFGL